MNSKLLIAAAVSAILLFGLVAFALAWRAAEREPEFGEGTYRDIETVLTDSGLLYNDPHVSDGDVTGGYEKRVYDVTDPEGNGGMVVVRAYQSRSDLDAIGDDSYTGDSVLGYRWQQYSISVTAATHPAVTDRFRDAMGDLGGADVLYDHL